MRSDHPWNSEIREKQKNKSIKKKRQLKSLTSWPGLSSTTWAFPWLKMLEQAWKCPQLSGLASSVLRAGRLCWTSNLTGHFYLLGCWFAEMCLIVFSVVYFPHSSCVWAALVVLQWIHCKAVSLFHILSLRQGRCKGTVVLVIGLPQSKAFWGFSLSTLDNQQGKALAALYDHPLLPQLPWTNDS